MKKIIALIIVAITATLSINAMALNDNFQAYQDIDHNNQLTQPHQTMAIKPHLSKFDNII